MNRRTFGGTGRHTIPALKRADGSDIVTRVKGSRDDVRKVLSRNGAMTGWMDSLEIDEHYYGRHRAAFWDAQVDR